MNPCGTCGTATKQKFCTRECYRNRPLAPLADRFWEKVDKNGPVPQHRPELGSCWVWTGSRDQDGYGVLSVDGKPVKAHRVAWFLAHGRWPEPCGLHACDGGGIGCVRIDHLFEGTHGDNSRDMVAKARHVLPGLVGAEHPNAKITDDDVRAMRTRHAEGESLKSLARDFHISRDNVSLIVRRKAWQHVA